MITDFVMTMGVKIFAMLAGLLPHFDAFDGVVVTFGTYLIPLVAGLASMGVWIPWPVVMICMQVIFPLWSASLLFKLARAIWSYVPLIGGSG